MACNNKLTRIEDQLNNFDSAVRESALEELAEGISAGTIEVPEIKNEVNMHFHTFFSFNAYGWSPSRIAWEARKYGLLAVGIVDFDVLDGMEEFLKASETIGLRSAVAMETRVFIPEYADKVLSSPNEPGIGYFMAGGCFEQPAKGTESAKTLALMRDMARRRNLQVMERVNNYLGSVQLNYDADVLPLTPSGNATERHILAAYDTRSRQVFGSDNEALAEFWAGALGVGKDDASELLADTPAFHEKMRSKLMKFGGVGYVAPTTDTFPDVWLVNDMIKGMRALPTLTWLDGTNPGESDMPALLGLFVERGTAVLNIIPDRNWNIKNADEKRIKVENLDKCVQAARDLDIPLCIGTELNKLGLPFVDNFAAPELQPYIADFIDGAYFLWGHTFLARNAGIGYASGWADSYFGDSRIKRNEFYIRVGRLADPVSARVKVAGKDMKAMSPEQVLRALD